MRLWRSCTIWRLALVLHERALADRVGVPFRDFQRPVEDLLGSHAAIDKALDLAAPEMAAGLEASFGGGGYTALQCSALLQLAWDHVSSALDGRESAFELHASGGIANWRSWLRRSFKDYNELANAVLCALDLPMPQIDLSNIPAAPPGMRRTVTTPEPTDKP